MPDRAVVAVAREQIGEAEHQVAEGHRAGAGAHPGQQSQDGQRARTQCQRTPHSISEAQAERAGECADPALRPRRLDNRQPVASHISKVGALRGLGAGRATIGHESGKAPDQNRLTEPTRVWRNGRDGSQSNTTATASPAKHPMSSSAPRSAAARVCYVLAEDPDLAEAIAPTHRPGAIEHCIAPAVNLSRGRWDGQRKDMTPDGIGLLVLRGLLIRRVGVGGGFGAELLGQGDLLRPWQGEGAQSTLSPTTGWQVLEPARIAVLDKRAATRFSRYPELTGRLVAKALERSRNLATAMAIAHHARVELRLHMLFWHLADRWGRVRPDGVSVPLRLTHSILADLVSARRPSVSTCLAELARRGVVQRDGREWLLRGDPPGELLQLQPIRVAADN